MEDLQTLRDRCWVDGGAGVEVNVVSGEDHRPQLRSRAATYTRAS